MTIPHDAVFPSDGFAELEGMSDGEERGPVLCTSPFVLLVISDQSLFPQKEDALDVRRTTDGRYPLLDTVSIRIPPK